MSNLVFEHETLLVVSLIALSGLVLISFIFFRLVEQIISAKKGIKRLSKRKVIRLANKIDVLASNSRSLISQYENQSFRVLNSMSARALDCLGLARKIVARLEDLLNEVEELLAVGNHSAIRLASEMLQSKIDLSSSNGIDSIIYSKEQVTIPDLTPLECASALDKAFGIIDQEVKMAEEEFETNQKKKQGPEEIEKVANGESRADAV